MCWAAGSAVFNRFNNFSEKDYRDAHHQHSEHKKWQNASQFSCDQKNGMFLGDLHPRPDVFTPIIEKLSSFQMASVNP